MIIAAAFSFVLTVFLVVVSIAFNFLMLIVILVRPNNKIPKYSTTNSSYPTSSIISSFFQNLHNLSKINTIDKETNTEESKPVTLICLCCKREPIVFKKLHENFPDELPHVMCLLCYQYVITIMGYVFCPNCSKFIVIFSIFNWFQSDICKQTRFQYSVAKTFHHSDHKPVNFRKFCVKGYNLCHLCEKIIT